MIVNKGCKIFLRPQHLQSHKGKSRKQSRMKRKGIRKNKADDEGPIPPYYARTGAGKKNKKTAPAAPTRSSKRLTPIVGETITLYGPQELTRVCTGHLKDLAITEDPAGPENPVVNEDLADEMNSSAIEQEEVERQLSVPAVTDSSKPASAAAVIQHGNGARKRKTVRWDALSDEDDASDPTYVVDNLFESQTVLYELEDEDEYSTSENDELDEEEDLDVQRISTHKASVPPAPRVSGPAKKGTNKVPVRLKGRCGHV
jgi:hypothetical protein